MAEYNFNVQDPYAAQAADIARRQKMAEIMQAQALQPIEKFSYNGIEARISPYQGLAKMLQAYMGGRGQAAALEEQKALGEKARSESQSQIKDFMSAMTGTPGMPERTVDYQYDKSERNNPNLTVNEMGIGNIPAVEAVAPDRQKALALALQSSNPMLQSAGGSLLTSILPKTPKWQASTKFNDKGEEIHGFVDINSPQPEDTFRASSTKPAVLVPVTTTDANGRPVQKFVNARTVSEEGISKPLEGFYGELQQMGVDLNSPQAKAILNSYVAGKSGNLTPKDEMEIRIKLANLGLSSQRAGYEFGGGATMPSMPGKFNVFDINRPSNAAAPQSAMPPAMPAQMPNQVPAQMPVQPPAAKLANALRNAPVTTAPAVAPAVIPNAAPIKANIPNVASTAAPATTANPNIINGIDISTLPKSKQDQIRAAQVNKTYPERYYTRSEGLTNLNDALHNYEKSIKGLTVGDTITPDRRVSIGTAYNNSLLQAKEIYNLGVLNGGDQAILEKILANPLNISTMAVSTDALLKQSKDLRRILENQANNLSSVYNAPKVKFNQPESTTPKVMTAQDVRDTAAKSGKSEAEVRAAAKTKGIQVQ
jgi:hypothetical protein